MKKQKTKPGKKGRNPAFTGNKKGKWPKPPAPAVLVRSARPPVRMFGTSAFAALVASVLFRSDHH